MAIAKKTVPVEVTLHDELAAKRAELVEAKRSHAARELVNPRALGRIRKEIARIQTKIHVKNNNEESTTLPEGVVVEEKKK